MTVIIHIGPPKTATTSLQNSIVPRLGLSFEIKPEWARALAMAPETDVPRRTDENLIVSDEGLGGFAQCSPETIAGRLARVFRQATVVFCRRKPLDQFYSLYRQRLINSVGVQSRSASAGSLLSPVSPAQFLDGEWQAYCQAGIGFFASIDVTRVRAAFTRHFGFETVDFGLLSRDSRAFALAFASACGVAVGLEMSCENVMSADVLDAALAQLPASAPAGLYDLYRRLFDMRLAPDQEAFIAAR